MSLNKKQTLIICALLLLPLAGLTISGTLNSNSYPNQSLLCFSASGYIDGSALFVKDVAVIYFNSDTEYDLTQYRPPDWDITSINITLSNINTSTYDMVVEDYAEQAVPLFARGPSLDDSLFLIGLMSFHLPDGLRVYFNKLSALLVIENFTADAYMNVYIFNAYWNSSYNVALPDQLLFNINRTSIEGSVLDFKTLNLTNNPNEYLYLDTNSNSTANNTYFLGLTQNVTSLLDPAVYWFFSRDSTTGDDGGLAVLFGTFGNGTVIPPTIWDPYWGELFDFCFKVPITPNNISLGLPSPNELGLKINGINVNDTGPGTGWWYTTENLSLNPLAFDFSSTWSTLTAGACPVSFTAAVRITYQATPGTLLALTLQTFFTTYFEGQSRYTEYLLLLAFGSIVAVGAGGYRANKRRLIPKNALKSLEHIILDHNNTGVLLWAFDFVSMEQDVALVSGFMSAIKSFLEEMKVGGLKRLGTEFGTFIREESQQLTATCITSDIGLDEELWIRGKLHKFLTQIEQKHGKQLEDWKGDVGQFKESFPTVLGSVIDLDRVRKLHEQKLSELSRRREKLQKEVNRYGAKLEELKSKHDSGELTYDEYTSKRLKTEYKYDKIQKEYIYASLFLSKIPLETVASPKELEKLEEVQKRFVEIRMEIEELRRKESEGTITEKDKKKKEKLQKELMKLVEKLDKFKKG